MARTRAKDLIQFPNGDVMTLAEAFTRGRVYVQGVDQYGGITADLSRARRFVARDIDSDLGWDIGKTYALGRFAP